MDRTENMEILLFAFLRKMTGSGCRPALRLHRVRHALPKVTPNHPGELRRCPTIEERLHNGCRKVAPGAEVRPDLEQNCPSATDVVFQTWAEFDQMVAKSDECWLILAQVWPTLAKSKPKLGPCERCFPNVGRRFPMLAKTWTTPTQINQQLAQIEQPASNLPPATSRQNLGGADQI